MFFGVLLAIQAARTSTRLGVYVCCGIGVNRVD